MGFIEKIIHLVVPRHSNNQKAKLLHSSSLIIIACLLVIWQGALSFLPSLGPNILGYSAQISPDEVVRLTNEKRASAGLSALTLNSTLSSAAYTKGRDMVDRDYWAHTAPDGTAPWKFFTDSGYRYRYAGENLARDFSNPSSAVEAWMNSPTHRDNILNPKYKEIGIGVVEGDLAGVDTTIIIQFFGSTYSDQVVEPLAQVQAVQKVEEAKITPPPISIPSPKVQTIVTSPQPTQEVLISPFTTTRGISLAVVGLLLAVFVIDSLLVRRRKIARIGGRAFAHIAFLGMIMAIILILKSGQIL